LTIGSECAATLLTEVSKEVLIEVVARKLKVRPNTISKARRKIARELRKKLV